MSTRLEVLAAIRELIETAVPLAKVIGLDNGTAPPARMQPGGQVVIRTGDPGQAQILMSPLTYLWSHRIPVEVTGPSEAVIDALFVAIGEAIVADRTLGGRVDWLDAAAPETDDFGVDGTAPLRGGEPVLIATYGTTNPLG